MSRGNSVLQIFYSEHYNIDLGLLNYLHPFDGTKFKKVIKELKGISAVDIRSPSAPVSHEAIHDFVDDLVRIQLNDKKTVLRILEVPQIPLLPFSYLAKKILLPMRWGVAGTVDASKAALGGRNCWNLAGGYHHASQQSAEGFCLYNDIGIAHQELLKAGLLKAHDKILIIDVDAHHGNGNAQTFMHNADVTLLDVYNQDNYPRTAATRGRVNIPVLLHTGVGGSEYLAKYADALKQLGGGYRIAYVVAGTDVLDSDPIGGMRLTPGDVVARETLTFNKLKSMGVPAVFLGAGGYSKLSASTIAAAIKGLVR
jgi:histone deacetylase 11